MGTSSEEATYAEWLRERIRERGLTLRALAQELNPDDPESARRALRRHLRGMAPTERTRRRYADVLGTDDIGPEPERRR